MFRYYFYLFFSAVCFFVIHNHIPSVEWHYILILFLLPLSVLFSYIHKKSIFIFTAASFILSLIFFGFSTKTVLVLLNFISFIPVMYYFAGTSPKLSAETIRKNNELKFYKQELLNEEQSLNIYKSSTEEKLEKTLQFYLLSKNLTKNISPIESGREICNIMIKRNGVVEVTVVMGNYNYDKLSLLNTTNPKNKNLWKSFLKKNVKELYNIKEISFITSSLSADNPVIFNQYDIELTRISSEQQHVFIIWPIIVEDILKAAIFIKIKKDFIKTYIDEGDLFIPYFSLHTRRIMLFLRVEEQARIDGLTKTYLRRYFITRLQAEIQRTKRYSTNFYLLMLDIDFFKNVNDTYGHLAGDNVLKTVAQTIMETTRPGDLVCRYGGEEFIILVPMNENDSKIVKLAENIRKTIKKIEFNDNDKKFNISVSIGIAKYSKNLNSANIISKADKALYEAKQTGRDKVVFYKDIVRK